VLDDDGTAAAALEGGAWSRCWDDDVEAREAGGRWVQSSPWAPGRGGGVAVLDDDVTAAAALEGGAWSRSRDDDVEERAAGGRRVQSIPRAPGRDACREEDDDDARAGGGRRVRGPSWRTRGGVRRAGGRIGAEGTGRCRRAEGIDRWSRKNR